MEDLHDIGGVPAVFKFMLDNNMLNGDCSVIALEEAIAQNLKVIAKCRFIRYHNAFRKTNRESGVSSFIW